jgi:hypothetical protein
MLKRSTVLSALAVTTAVFLLPSQQALARNGAAVAAGVGGFALGAAVGAAATAPRSYYSGPAYVEPYYAPVYGHCYRTREWDGFRYRRVRVCD